MLQMLIFLLRAVILCFLHEWVSDEAGGCWKPLLVEEPVTLLVEERWLDLVLGHPRNELPLVLPTVSLQNLLT